ncbi:hypothetical protein PC123_g13832 [Phytophthora cactorum]|nr:hypothetical protein PC123_g13832 [Phytophthora cactorum]
MILGRPLRQELLYAESALRTPTRSVSPLSANRNGTSRTTESAPTRARRTCCSSALARLDGPSSATSYV